MDELELTVNQAESEKAETEEPEIALATVGDITENGVKLKFDGADSYSEKEYKCNTGIMIRTGDRVKVSKISGTYIVEYVVGAPMSDYPIPVGTEGQYFTNSDGDRTGTWSDAEFMVAPSGGSTGQVLTKSATSYQWQAVPTELPTSGTTGYYLQKTSTGNKWAAVTQYSGPTINGSSTTTLGFYNTTAITQQTLSTSYNNMGYTSATASNYLYILNNIAGILKKLGLLK